MVERETQVANYINTMQKGEKLENQNKQLETKVKKLHYEHKDC